MQIIGRICCILQSWFEILLLASLTVSRSCYRPAEMKKWLIVEQKTESTKCIYKRSKILVQKMIVCLFSVFHSKIRNALKYLVHYVIHYISHAQLFFSVFWGSRCPVIMIKTKIKKMMIIIIVKNSCKNNLKNILVKPFSIFAGFHIVF